MTPNPDDLKAWEGLIVPRSFQPWLVATSWVVSLVGSQTTVELLSRLTAGRGWYNIYLLGGSSTVMGSVAIWSMHFLANRAISLNHGRPGFQIDYSYGCTAASIFLPITVLPFAFWVVGSTEQFSVKRMVISGTVVAGAICGMHYLGQQGIANYDCVYRPELVVVSALIAEAASLLALKVFFNLRKSWTDHWYKRVPVAIVLATTVSGMHWTASVGTNYRLRAFDDAPKKNLSGWQSMIIVIVLSISACIILMTIAILCQVTRKRTMNRAQQVVVACATFDSEGRLMTTAEGYLPSEKITDAFEEQSLEDIFGIGHPVYTWLFRATRNWRTILKLIPRMRSHLRANSILKDSRPGTSSDDASNFPNSPSDTSYSVTFRELFCVAAASLADQVHQPLDRIGVLYDKMMVTGTTKRFRDHGRFSQRPIFASDDLEAAPPQPPPVVFGRGKLLFLVRRTNRADTASLRGAGFRFSRIDYVLDFLARSMQVNRDELANYLAGMYEYSKTQKYLDPGVYIACFALRPMSLTKSFEILVRKSARAQLPAISLDLAELKPGQADFFAQFDGMTAAKVVESLENYRFGRYSGDSELAPAFLRYLKQLLRLVNDPCFFSAVFYGRPCSAPCSLSQENSARQATLFAFYIADAHLTAKAAECGQLMFSPFNLFNDRQRCYDGCPDHEAFARRMFREFAPVLKKEKSMNGSNSERRASNIESLARPAVKRWFSFWPFTKKKTTDASNTIHPDDASDLNLVQVNSSQRHSAIVVRSDFAVEESRRPSIEEIQELRAYGCATGAEFDDTKNFADVLWEAALARRGSR
ncbi:hypothetical protein L228DRAFT_83667 [Xylona heveae TC161]|uniref:MHYT domain-containing protein n=1 Tax=Xylona heveae (strain CBS 132557 / TC161) TaxID=1328760 RepID=A0A165J622_XYLHT|nr:hypothetical protein L228DRAFT_83667 [Xylona heveae TC161]KZF25782.1 hypothetical protein L228DRAFT_83667 [Xylona heveae TC161]